MFSQFRSPEHTPGRVGRIVKVKCEKSGTVYYKNTKTGQTAWRAETLAKNPRTRDK